MTNNQMKCSIMYEKIMMQVGDDERMINYEWPYNHVSLCDLILFIIPALQLNIIPLSVTMDRKIKKPLVKLNFW